MNTSESDESNLAYRLGFKVGWSGEPTSANSPIERIALTLTLLFFTFSAPPIIASDNASFDTQATTLTIPSVNVADQSAYFLQLSLTQTEPELLFDVADVSEITWSDDNQASFSLASGVLSVPNLYVGKQRWNVTLELIADSLQFRAVSGSPVTDILIMESYDDEQNPFVIAVGDDQFVPFFDAEGMLNRVDHIAGTKMYLESSTREVSYRFDQAGNLDCISTHGFYGVISISLDSDGYTLLYDSCSQESGLYVIENLLLYRIETPIVDPIAMRTEFDEWLAGSYTQESSGEIDDWQGGHNENKWTDRDNIYMLFHGISQSDDVYACVMAATGNNAWISNNAACEM